MPNEVLKYAFQLQETVSMAITCSFYFPYGRPLEQTGTVAKSFKLKGYLGNKSFPYNTFFEWTLSQNILRPWKKTIQAGSRQISQCFQDRADACGSGVFWEAWWDECFLLPSRLPSLSSVVPCLLQFKAPKAPLWRKLQDSWSHVVQSLVSLVLKLLFCKYVLWSMMNGQEILYSISNQEGNKENPRLTTRTSYTVLKGSCMNLKTRGGNSKATLVSNPGTCQEAPLHR